MDAEVYFLKNLDKQWLAGGEGANDDRADGGAGGGGG